MAYQISVSLGGLKFMSDPHARWGHLHRRCFKRQVGMEGWPTGGGVHFWVDPNLIPKFNPDAINVVTLQLLIAEGNQHAQQDRARLGLGAPRGGQKWLAPRLQLVPHPMLEEEVLLVNHQRLWPT